MKPSTQHRKLTQIRPFLLAAALAATLTACTKQNVGDSTTANNNDKPIYGSATDIASGDGTQRNTNQLDAADNGLGGPAQREAGNYQNRPDNNTTNAAAANPDQELAKRIKVAITTGSTGTSGVIAADQLTPINVQVQNGVVTLTGPVTSDAEARTIEKRVADMKGVHTVINHLTPGAEPLKQLK